MKKNKMIYTVMAGALVLSTVGSMSVFAEDTTTLAAEQSQTEQTQPEATESQYMTVAGKIESVQKEEDYYTISVANDNMGMVFTVKESVFVIESKNGDTMKLDDLQEGMDITAIVAKKSPMTMSIPPMTSGAIGFVVGNENNIMIGYFDETLTSQEAMLALNISEDTKIVDIQGTKQVFTQDSVKNQDCLVLYGITTRSIPAQTTPDFVMLLNTAQEQETTASDVIGVVETKEYMQNQQQTQSEANPTDSASLNNEGTEDIAVTETKETVANQQARTDEGASIEETPAEAVTLLPLRDTAEKAGFTVTWTGNDKPVVLEKDGVQIEVTVGSAEYKKADATFTSGKTTVLQDSKIYIGSDVVQEITK